MSKIKPVNSYKLKNYSREFYDAHPDLAPRGNLLMYYGRIAGREEINKKFNSAFKITPWMKARLWIVNKAMDVLDWIEKKK